MKITPALALVLVLTACASAHEPAPAPAAEYAGVLRTPDGTRPATVEFDGTLLIVDAPGAHCGIPVYDLGPEDESILQGAGPRSAYCPGLGGVIEVRGQWVAGLEEAITVSWYGADAAWTFVGVRSASGH